VHPGGGGVHPGGGGAHPGHPNGFRPNGGYHPNGYHPNGYHPGGGAYAHNPGHWQNHPWYNNWHHGYYHGNWGGPGYAGGFNRFGWGGGWYGGWGSPWGWGGGWGGGWGRPWGWGWGRPWGWGWGWGIGLGTGLAAGSLVGWGLGTPYYNPYYSQPYIVGNGVALNYSQPLNATAYVDPTTQTDYPDDSPLISREALDMMDQARSAFMQGDYPNALQLTNSAISQMPRDQALHEFRALVLFALGKYRDAAATLNSVLAVGPGWDWTTLNGFYPSVDVYEAQLRTLENYIRQNPQAADARFVLAYHYMTAGHTDAAVQQFREVVKLSPRDAVAAQLLQGLAPDQQQNNPPDPGANVEPTPSPEEVETPTDDADAQARMLGQWRAQSPEGANFNLTLKEGSKFAWTFTQGGKTNTISGDYVLGDGTLLLKDPKGGGIAGQVVNPTDNSFTLHMFGAPAGQGDLVFRR